MDTARPAGDLDEPSARDRADVPTLAIPAIASGAAAVLHAAAAGIHADHPGLSRVFMAIAVLQAAAAAVAFLRRDRPAAWLLVGVNLVALAGWITTRLTGIEWIGGLEVAERPQLADSIAAAFAAVAIVGAVAAWSPGARAAPARAATNAAILAGVLLVPGLADTTTHEHTGTDGHDHAGTIEDGEVHVDDGHAHAAEPSSSETAGSGISSGGDIDAALAEVVAGQHVDDGHAHPSGAPTEGAAAWPRPWDPATDPVDFSGVPGVSEDQQARAEQLVRDTVRDLPAFADVSTVAALGYRSIGDAGTGFEHYINYELIGDDTILDPSAPESLVYAVDGDRRTLVSAMFIAGDTPIDDPDLVAYGGALMQWHVHENLCWGLGENGQPMVVAVLEAPGDTCPAGTINAGAENPMVHVWIAPHECGPFAALEGHGAGQVDDATGQRVDQCGHEHAGDTNAADDVTTRPYDPTQPIDLGGVEGVTAEQQAFAENLVAATVRDLPQWADLATVEAAGFRSIGDAATGHEHYIQWDWIDDEVWLDPDYPESLVFEPQPDGTKTLVSAMFMLPPQYALDTVPDLGGALMQWHVHGDLCFTDDPEAPQVRGVRELGVPCQAPLVEGTLAPMIHVWITPTPCGPFAALEGIAGGQVPEGEDVLCDHLHGV